MNAQLNSINFQQFVSENKGKSITFKHNDITVSKVVVDVCGDYFTGKTNESDAKIDGFYYFSDCKMIDEKHLLIETLEQHNVSVLNLGIINSSCIFKYNHYIVDRNMINGTCLTTSQPVGFHVDSVKEVWTVVDCKYTKVYPQQENSVLPTNKAVYSDEQKYQNIKTNMRALLQFYTYVEYFTHITDKQRFFYLLKEIYNHTYSDELYRKFVNIWENELKAKLITVYAKNRSNGYLQALVKRFAEICKIFKPNCDISFLSEYKFSELSNKIHSQIINTCVSEEFNLLENKIENKIENKNNFSSASSINIEYRGKPKTVQVINEYTHLNGKDYVLINDLTDNGKTKTLFKEYIKYL